MEQDKPLDSASLTQQEAGSEVALRGEELHLQAADRAADEFRKLAERSKNILTLHRQSIIDRYLHYGLTIICDLDVSSPVTWTRSVARRNEGPIRNIKSVSVVYCANPLNTVVVQMDRPPLLSLGVENVHGPDGLAIPSLVRLYNVHDELEDVFGGVMFQSQFNGAFKVISGRVDREYGDRGIVMGNVQPSGIECTSEVAEGFGERGQEVNWHGLWRFKPEQVVSGLRIMLNDDRIGVSVAGIRDHGVKIVDVLLGPFNL